MFTFGTPLRTPKTMSAERQTRILINRWSAQRASIPERLPVARIPKLMQGATLKHADLVTQSWVLQLQGSARTKDRDRVARSVLREMSIRGEISPSKCEIRVRHRRMKSYRKRLGSRSPSTQESAPRRFRSRLAANWKLSQCLPLPAFQHNPVVQGLRRPCVVLVQF